MSGTRSGEQRSSVSLEKTMILIPHGEASVLELLREQGAALSAPCGGNGRCGACRVVASGAVKGPVEGVKTLRNQWVQACRTIPAGELTVTLPPSEKTAVRLDARPIPGGGQGLGLAVDMGTTTVAAYLYDLCDGTCLAQAGEANAQRAFGADVIARISHAADEKSRQKLMNLGRKQLQKLAAKLAKEAKKEGERLQIVSVAGNTVMLHLLAGLSPESIGKAPFTPLSLFGDFTHWEEFGETPIYLCPAVAGYVGGDITAGLLSSGAADSEGLTLFLDIGTNGEMCLGRRGRWLCCAAAAGPAFEGAELSCGMAARPGAIDRVSPEGQIHVLGGGEAVGLCGSGAVDALAAGLASGRIDETGRMAAGRWELAPGVWLSREDIRALQLAKAAIRAGIEVLLQEAGKDYDDVEQLLLAGGFGCYLPLDSAGAIGLLPRELLGKTRHVGNSAGQGAALALRPEGRAALEQLRAVCEHRELSLTPAFSDAFINAMGFEEDE